MFCGICLKAILSRSCLNKMKKRLEMYLKYPSLQFILFQMKALTPSLHIPTRRHVFVSGGWRLRATYTGQLTRFYSFNDSIHLFGRWVNPEMDSHPQRLMTRSLIFSCAWTNGWVNNRYAGDLGRHHAHFDVTVIIKVDAVSVVSGSNQLCNN